MRRRCFICGGLSLGCGHREPETLQDEPRAIGWKYLTPEEQKSHHARLERERMARKRRMKAATDLEMLIELARKHTITESEHDAQVRSFAYGNTHFENEDITREDIDRAVDALGVQWARWH